MQTFQKTGICAVCGARITNVIGNIWKDDSKAVWHYISEKKDTGSHQRCLHPLKNYILLS